MRLTESPSGRRWIGICGATTANAALIVAALAAFGPPRFATTPVDALQSIAIDLAPLPPPQPTLPGEARPAPTAAPRKPAQRSPAAAPAAQPVRDSAVRAADTAPASERSAQPPLRTTVAPLAARVTVAPPRSAENTDSPTPLAAYTQMLRQRILERRPRGLRKEGAPTVAFTVSRAGAVSGIGVTRPSGDIQLDRLAERMVRQSAPFPVPPAEIPDAALTFSIEVRFH